MSADNPKIHFRPLPRAAQQNLENQRAFVSSLVEKYLPGNKFTRTKPDLLILQKIVDLHIIPKENTWELQALGAVFGDAMASIIPGLAWYEVTDEYGTGPTMRYKATSIQVNTLTMISKRIEDGENVDVVHLAFWLQDFVQKKSHEFQ